MATSILIVKLSSLGDVLHTLPAAQALRRRYPDAHIAWAVEAAHSALLNDQPWLDERIVWERNAAGGFRKFVSQLRSQPWDLAIDFQGLFRSGLVTRLSGARRRVGSRQAREFAGVFYNQRVNIASPDRHAVEKNLELIAPLFRSTDIADVVPGMPLERPYLFGQAPLPTQQGREWFPLYPSAADIAEVDAWCNKHGYEPHRERLVVINPDCRRQANRWPPSRFIELARRLLKIPGVRVALTGGPGAKLLCDQIAYLVGKQLWRADGRLSILGSTELLSRSHLLLTGDTGPMHLAAAVDLPVVALVGATSPVRTGPYTTDAVVLREPLECSPCLAKKCRLGHALPPCMDRIEVESVIQTILRRLDSLPALQPPMRKTA